MRKEEDHLSRPAAPAEFATTHWSVVVRAGSADKPESTEALTVLFQTYWYPLYAYVRRRQVNSVEAEDIVQGFFARLLEKNVLAGVTVDRGRFRSFLLTAIKNYLLNERDHSRAAKRGGARQVLSLDFDAAESRLALEPVSTTTAERTYERQWALTVLEMVMQRLEAEYRTAGKERQFEVLKQTLASNGDRIGYAALGVDLRISEAAARQAASRLRKRYRELLRGEVANTLTEPADVDDEIRSLFGMLKGGR